VLDRLFGEFPSVYKRPRGARYPRLPSRAGKVVDASAEANEGFLSSSATRRGRAPPRGASSSRNPGSTRHMKKQRFFDERSNGNRHTYAPATACPTWAARTSAISRYHRSMRCAPRARASSFDGETVQECRRWVIEHGRRRYEAFANQVPSGEACLFRVYE